MRYFYFLTVVMFLAADLCGQKPLAFNDEIQVQLAIRKPDSYLEYELDDNGALVTIDIASTYTPSLSLGYQHYFFKRWAVNTSVGFHRQKQTRNGNFQIAYRNLDAQINNRFYWVQRKYIGLYGGLGLLYRRQTISSYYLNIDVYPKTTHHFDLQFVPIGLRVGGRAGGYIEADVFIFKPFIWQFGGYYRF